MSLLLGTAPAQALDRTPPNLTGATVNGRTLTLTYNEALNETSVPPADLYEVTVRDAGSAGPRFGRPIPGLPVGIYPHSRPPADGTRRSISQVAVSGATVTLTLTRAVLRGEIVTMSYLSGALAHSVSRLRDLAGNPAWHIPFRAVTNTTTNSSVPVYSGPAPTSANAPPGTLVSFAMPSSRFSDPDGDALTLSLSATRDDVLTDLYYGSDERVYARTKANCVLANLRPTPGNPLTTVITVTASDAQGAAAEVKQPLTTSFACPLLSSAVARDKVLTLTYDSLPAGWSPAAGEFTVKVDRAAMGLAATNPVSVSGSIVTLALAAPVARNQAVTVSHAPGADPKTTGFTDRAARVDSTNNAPVPIAPYSPVQHVVPRPPPSPGSTVYMLTSPGTFRNIAAFRDPDGDAVTLSLTTTGGFGAATVTGSGSSAYLTTKTVCEMRRITPAPPESFATVVGVTASDPAGATSGLTIVATTRWTPKRCPLLARAAVNGASLTLTYDKELHPRYVPKASSFDVRVDGSTAALAAKDPVAVSGSTVVLTLAAPVAGGSAVTLSFTTSFWSEIRSRRGDEAESFSNLRVSNPPADPASVAGVSVASSAGADRTYGRGDIIHVQVAFDEAVEVTGSPRLKIDMDPAHWGEKWAVYDSGSGTSSLIFAHTVVEPNLSTQGIAVLGNTLELDGGTIRSGGADADLGHDGLAHDANHRVDWRTEPASGADGTNGPGGLSGDGGPPSVTAISVVSEPGANTTYLLGDTILIRATFSEAVTVTGSPGLKIDMDPAHWGEKRAAYESGSGTSSLTFAHTVVEPNYSTRGIAVLANSLALDGGTIRSAGGANAVLGHGGLGHDSGHKVDWRPDISVADARAIEGTGVSVAFEVSLSRAFTGAEHRVTVHYATADGTATAGADYTATSGTLIFAAGETSKTVNVPVLDDSHDESEETFTLTLSNVTGARIGDGEATGTIANADPMPRAWLARFGRTVADQVVAGVQARLEAPRSGGASARIAGRELAGGGGLDADNALTRWLAGTPEQPRTMTGGELLAGSAFAVSSASAAGGPSAALWGRGGWSRFDGSEGSLSVDGEVISALFGAEMASDAWLGGVMLAHARGDGSYRSDADTGTVASALTAVHPYVGVHLSERVTAWAAGGLGLGGLTLTPEGAEALETDLSLALAALGARGRLVEPAAGSGFSLAIESDAYWVRTSAAAASGLAETQADATRIRLGLDGGYRLALAGGGMLAPTVEIGVRNDGGHAETGYGMDVGGGLAWSAPALGLSAQVAARGLLTGAFDGFRDLGLSGSLAWDPDPASDRGPSLTVTQSVGAAATGGSHTLLGQPTLAGLAATDFRLDRRRVDLRAGYGFAAAGDRLTLTPELGIGLSDTAREYTLGWRLDLAQHAPMSFEFGIEATRKESADNDPEHGLGLTMTASW